MIAEGTDPSKVTEEQCAQIIEEVKKFIAAEDIKHPKVAKSIGISPSTISEVLSGKYRADSRPILMQLDAWMDREIKRKNAPATTSFVWTNVALEIEAVANLASQLSSIGLVYGPDTSGFGKTMALQAIHAKTPGSILVTIEKAHANPTGLLRAIAKAIWPSKSEQFIQRNNTLYDLITAKLRDSGRLLLIDQIHNLRFSKDDKPLYFLTDIHDHTKAPQLWCGTADIAAYLNRRSAKLDESLAQINSRLNPKRDLTLRTLPREQGGSGEPLFTVEQVREMFAKNKIRITPDGIRMLWQLACVPDSGSLRVCRNIVQVATIVATHQGKTSIGEDQLWDALRNCVQAGTYSDLRERIDTNDGDARRLKVG